MMGYEAPYRRRKDRPFVVFCYFALLRVVTLLISERMDYLWIFSYPQGVAMFLTEE